MSRIIAAILIVWWTVVGCAQTHTDPAGGETHFLQACNASNTCGAGLTCLCNVCTLPCDDRDACGAFLGSQCVAGAACSSATSGRTCDLPCAQIDDCRALSGNYVCAQGYCRLSKEPTTSGQTLACDQGSVPSSDVLVIGDNLFAGTNRVAIALENAAREGDVLASDQHIQDNSSDTNDALAFMGGGIANQYTTGNAGQNVKLVIMTGGGVDAVFGSCAELDNQCPVLVSAAQAAQDLIQSMSADGVRYAVYAFYPDPADPSQKARIDVLRSLIEPICQSAALTCHFLDLRPIFAGHAGTYVTTAGLTEQGAAATADAIWSSVKGCLSP